MLQHVLVVWFYKNTVILSVSEESPGMKRQRRSSDINPFRICDIHSCVRYKAAPCDMPAGVGDLYHIATKQSEVISHGATTYIDIKQNWEPWRAGQ